MQQRGSQVFSSTSTTFTCAWVTAERETRRMCRAASTTSSLHLHPPLWRCCSMPRSSSRVQLRIPSSMFGFSAVWLLNNHWRIYSPASLQVALHRRRLLVASQDGDRRRWLPLVASRDAYGRRLRHGRSNGGGWTCGRVRLGEASAEEREVSPCPQDTLVGLHGPAHARPRRKEKRLTLN